MITAADAKAISLFPEESRKDLARQQFKETAQAIIKQMAHRGKDFAEIIKFGISKEEGIEFFENLGYKVRIQGAAGTFDSYTFFLVSWK